MMLAEEHLSVFLMPCRERTPQHTMWIVLSRSNNEMVVVVEWHRLIGELAWP